MKRLRAALVIVFLLALAACAPSLSSANQQADPPTVGPTLPAITLTEFVPTALPVTPTYEGCYYVWASQDMPELSRKLNAALQEISTDATGLAYAYGENCVYGDGHSTFSAMETDFRVGVIVKTVRDQDAMGDWIRRVMDIILDLPPDELQGPHSGRVDFTFKQPDPAELFVTVPIDKYRLEADDLRGAALFRLFYNNP